MTFKISKDFKVLYTLLSSSKYISTYTFICINISEFTPNKNFDGSKFHLFAKIYFHSLKSRIFTHKIVEE